MRVYKREGKGKVGATLRRTWKVFLKIVKQYSVIIMTFASIIIALSILWLSYTQRNEALKYYRLSTLPTIQIFEDMHWQPNEPLGLYIVSNGPGPACIKNITLELDDKTYDLTYDGPYFEAIFEIKRLMGIKPSHISSYGGVLKLIGGGGFYFSFFRCGCLNSGGKIMLFVTTFKEINHDNFIKFKKILERMSIVIKYESIYGETFYYRYH